MTRELKFGREAIGGRVHQRIPATRSRNVTAAPGCPGSAIIPGCALFAESPNPLR